MKRILRYWLAALAALAALAGRAGEPGPRPLAFEYFGTCGASAGAFLDETHFVMANDEDCVLRVYRLGQAQPVAARDVSGFLQLDRQRPEVDLEAAARAGDLVWWLGSHSRTAAGRLAPNRHRLFATRIVPAAAPGGVPGLEPHGQPCTRLLEDLLVAPTLRAFPLAAAASRAPEEPGGLNLEGLAAAPDGRLWIGFRNPVIEGRALLVPLENPDAAWRGEPVRAGEPAHLDLGGLGVRDLLWAGGRCWVLAGPAEGGGNFRLFVWSGPGTPAREVLTRFPRRFRPEGLLGHPHRSPAEFFVLSDDGSLRLGECECRDLPDPAQRRFRAAWVSAER